MKNVLYHYKYSRYYRPVSVIFDLFSKISRRNFILRENVVPYYLLVHLPNFEQDML